MKIPSPRGGPPASQMLFPWSAPRTAPAGRAHALLARGLPLLLIALAALVLSSVGHAQDLDPVLVSNTGQAAGSDLATATGRVSYAQSFTTGDHPDGYFLSLVEVGLKAGSGVTAEVALWWADRLGSPVRGDSHRFVPNHKLTALTGVSSIDNDASTLERFSANDVLLLPHTTYWIVVTRTGGADDGLSVATTSSEDAVDAAGTAGFSVGKNVWVPDPDEREEWADYSSSVDASMKISLRGSEASRPPGPYATNRNEWPRAAPAETSAAASRYATSFRTTFSSDSDTHQLTSVLLDVAADSGVSPRVAIHADNGGSPAASAVTNGTLTAPASVSDVLGAPERAEFTASPAISLAEGTRYWVVLDVGSGSGSLSVSTTAGDSNDLFSAGEWSIGDTMKAYRGTSWSDDSQGRSFRMALNGPTEQVDLSIRRPPRLGIGLPQVGVGVAAEIQDRKFTDRSFRVKNATWQWQRGETRDGTFTDIPAEQGGTSRVYVPAAADLGKWLKALASYENAFGPGKSVSGVSDNAVLSQPIMSNAGQVSDGSYALGAPGTVRVAQAFTTGGNSSGYLLSGLRFGIGIDTDADALSWALHADDAGEPGAAPLFAHIAVPSDSLDDDVDTFEDLVHPGFPLARDTKYWAVLTASPLMEGNVPILILAGFTEFGDHVIFDGPAAELDPGSASDWTLYLSTLASPTDPMSTEEWVHYATALELAGRSVLRMSVLTYPEVTASFGQGSYTVAEGATQSVTVTLSADPERTVTIPIVTMGQDGASSADYSGVPESVTFNAGGATEMTFTFTATQDTVDDEGESVLLGFGSDLSGGVSAGTPGETTVNITDDDPPEVSFGESAYLVAEGDVVSVEVTLTSALGSAVTVPITHTPQDGASSADYSGVPANVMFTAGETSKTFTFTAATDDDDGESVLLGFGPLPATVQTGTTTQSTITITIAGTPAGCESGDIWCATVEYYFDSTASHVPRSAGRYLLVGGYPDDNMSEFVYKGIRYEVVFSTLGPNPGGMPYVRPPFHIPERSKMLLSLFHLRPSDRQSRWEVPNQDYLDWTLYISTGTGSDMLEAKLPLNEAKFSSGHSWRWHGLDLYELNLAWAAGKEYKLRIVEDPRADRTPEVLGPPLYLEALGVNCCSALVRWVRPQVRNDGAPPGVSYKVQWKTSFGAWDTPAVSQHVYSPPSGKEVLSWAIRGLTPDRAYDVRVIAVNAAGDSAPSNVLRVHTDEPFRASQNQAANSPATGGPGIVGRALAGETLTATTSDIEDEDGLADAVLAYQWIRQDLATLEDTNIDGATSSTYTVTDADEGKAIKVRVTFTDDAGNPESVTSDAVAVAVALRLRSATLDGATLTLTYNETLDSFVSLPQAAFTVSVNAVSRSVNAVSVAGASVTLTLASAAQAGDTVTVDYAKPNGPDFIRDTQGRVAASFSGRAVGNDTPPSALTAAIHGAPESHDEQEDFTFELRFSEAPKTGFSDETLRDDAFTVTGGTVVGARQLDPPGNVSWEISVRPASSEDMTIILPVTTDCDADGATCTEDGRMLSSRLEFTVNGPEPLTASSHDAPASHDGSADFTFELRLSEAPVTDFSYKTLKDHAFTVTRGTVEGGTVDGARRLVSGSNIRWEISVSPDSDGDITVVLPVTEDCDADGAICTEDGRMLSSPLEFTVSGPPLTAAIHDAPGSHNGQGAFKFELRFSEELGKDFSYTTLKDHAFTVTGGAVDGARRLDGDSDTPNIRWEITVKPGSNADVTVKLPATTDCDPDGAICTDYGKKLSNGLELTVSGPGQ